MGINPNGRDWGSLVNWDDLGKFYAAFTIIWTVVLFAGVVWLVLNRRLTLVKIRNLPLSIAAVSFLHVYLVKICLAYTTNGNFSCGAEFWIMSIYLPFGIALFQASLVQLRSVFDQQQDYLRYTPEAENNWPYQRVSGFWNYWRSRPKVQQAYIWIGLGMAIQFIVTGVLYGTTPTLQGDWTSFGDITHAKGQAKCRGTLQWIPSAFWQLFYAWVYGPYILYSIRNIRDAHYWRLQVILSVVSGLPGAPLWLASVYSKGFKPINPWWVPPMWLTPGIVVMQGVTIFIPIYEAWKSKREIRSILSILEDWQQRRHAQSGADKPLTAALHGSKSYQDSTSDASWTSSMRKSQMFTMESLEKALAVNPKPLLHYAATRDFTAENIVFLLQVRRWRAAWLSASGYARSITQNARAHLYVMAVQIYIASVNEKTAEYPINVEGPIRSALDAVFARGVPEGKYRRSVRFDLPNDTLQRKTSDSDPDSEFPDSWEKSPAQLEEKSHFTPHPGVAPLGKARAKIPVEFDESVFDAAEKSIKYLVLTNTWRKFVNSSDQDLPSTIGRQPSLDGAHSAV